MQLTKKEIDVIILEIETGTLTDGADWTTNGIDLQALVRKLKRMRRYA